MGHLDSDLLRTFVAVAETGSLTQAAARVLRTQSAVSLQIKKLEATIEQPVFERHGRGVSLTPAGKHLLLSARHVIATLDTTLRELTADSLTGRVRLGFPDDHSQDTLAGIIAAFSQSHPLVELDVICDLSARFPALLDKGELDLAVYEVETPDDPSDVLWSDPTQWVMSRNHNLLEHDVLPVALFDRDCWWRSAALDALNTMERPFRVVYSSQSVQGVMAAVEAGVAVALMGSSALGTTVRALDTDDGFPKMPASNLIVRTTEDQSTSVKTIESAIRRAFENRVSPKPAAQT